jgi:PAS domain-containing protein
VDAHTQRPLELILARNLLASLSTPACLVNAPGDVIFYNDAAGRLFGRRFEETGAISAQNWVEAFGPIDEHGERIPVDEQPLTIALRANRAGHAQHRIRLHDGHEYDVEVSAMPLVGADGFNGAMVFFWVTGEAGP